MMMVVVVVMMMTIMMVMVIMMINDCDGNDNGRGGKHETGSQW